MPDLFRFVISGSLSWKGGHGGTVLLWWDPPASAHVAGLDGGEFWAEPLLLCDLESKGNPHGPSSDNHAPSALLPTHGTSLSAIRGCSLLGTLRHLGELFNYL